MRVSYTLETLLQTKQSFQVITTKNKKDTQRCPTTAPKTLRRQHQAPNTEVNRWPCVTPYETLKHRTLSSGFTPSQNTCLAACPSLRKIKEVPVLCSLFLTCRKIYLTSNSTWLLRIRGSVAFTPRAAVLPSSPRSHHNSLHLAELNS